jgi:hypothetical protein
LKPAGGAAVTAAVDEVVSRCAVDSGHAYPFACIIIGKIARPFRRG